MAAPVGNRFWEARSSHGRSPIFGSPDDLWNACCEYFAWVEENPLQEEKIFQYQGAVVRDTSAKMRAMTVDGLCIFLDICKTTWVKYCSREDFVAITSRVEAIIRTQKFTGAAADLLNQNIIARELGLADKSELSGPNGGPIRTSREMTDDELAAIAAGSGAGTTRPA